MIIKELNPLDVKIGDKLVDYISNVVYTVMRKMPTSFLVGKNPIGRGIGISMTYDIYGIQFNTHPINTKIKLAYTNKLKRLIPL